MTQQKRTNSDRMAPEETRGDGLEISSGILITFYEAHVYGCIVSFCTNLNFPLSYLHKACNKICKRKSFFVSLLGLIRKIMSFNPFKISSSFKEFFLKLINDPKFAKSNS